MICIHNVIQYIAGFVVRKLAKKMSCTICVGAMIRNNIGNSLELIEIKNNGGLIKPSHDIVVLCKKAEHVFKNYQHNLSSFRNNPINYLIIKATSSIEIYKMFI